MDEQRIEYIVNSIVEQVADSITQTFRDEMEELREDLAKVKAMVGKDLSTLAGGVAGLKVMLGDRTEISDHKAELNAALEMEKSRAEHAVQILEKAIEELKESVSYRTLSD